MSRPARWIIVIALCFMVLLFTAVLAVFMAGRPQAVVRSGSVLVLDLGGDLPEQDSRSPVEALLDQDRPVLHDITLALQRAANDSRVEAVQIRCQGIQTGWGKLRELRDAIVAFRASGKKVLSQMEFATGSDYYIASAADEVYMVPTGLLDVSGLLADVDFYKGALAKLGVEAEMEHIGDYKNASDIFTRDSMSEAHREALTAILDSLSGQFRTAIAESRDLSPATVDAIVDRGLHTAEEALEAGLLDGLLYQDEAESRLEEEVGYGYPSIYPTRYGAWDRGGIGQKIAIVYATGTIVSGESGSGSFGDSYIGSDSLGRILREVRDDSRVAAVVLRIDSPGGSGIASDAIWREIQMVREEKPVVASMSDVAASGGYYIAMGTDAIVAQPGTLTGSIGVITGKFNLRGLYDWVGLRREQIKRGENADIFSDYTPFTDEQRGLIRSQMMSFYRTFLDKAAEGRGMEVEQVDSIAQGRVWTGEDAARLGLVDELGGIDRAIALAREKAGIAEDRSVTFEIYPRKQGLWDVFGDRRTAATVIESLPMTPEMRGFAARWAAATRLAGETVLAWAPEL